MRNVDGRPTLLPTSPAFLAGRERGKQIKAESPLTKAQAQQVYTLLFGLRPDGR
jgi:hypothetical protein